MAQTRDVFSLFKFLTPLILLVFAMSPTAAEDGPGEQLQNRLSQYSGQVVYVDFWASWCKPCRHSFPWMNELLAQYEKQGLKIVTVNLDKERHLAEQFLKENPADFEIIYDPEGRLAKQFKLKGMPMSFILGRDGKVASSHVGFNDLKKVEYEEEIKRLLGSTVD